MKFFSVIFTAALATAVLAAPIEVSERQVEAQGLGSGSESFRGINFDATADST